MSFVHMQTVSCYLHVIDDVIMLLFPSLNLIPDFWRWCFQFSSALCKDQSFVVLYLLMGNVWKIDIIIVDIVLNTNFVIHIK